MSAALENVIPIHTARLRRMRVVTDERTSLRELHSDLIDADVRLDKAKERVQSRIGAVEFRLAQLDGR